MKQFYLIVSIFLCITHSSHAMELIKKKHTQKQEPICTWNVHFIFGINDANLTSVRGKHHRFGLDGIFLNTQSLMKGVDWDDVSLIQDNIKLQGNINYTYPEHKLNEHSKLNLIQIACKEKKYETIKALLAAPDLNINAHEIGTYPAIHLAIKRGDKDIIQLLFDFVGKGYCHFVHDAYYTAYTYMKNNKCNELYHYFIHAEKMLHRFLRFEASHKQYALFTQILKEKYVEDRDEIPKELQQYITTLYYVLNIDTVVYVYICWQ